MSTTNKKLLLLKSKQFTSRLVFQQCYLKGINVKYPFTYIPKEIAKDLYKKFRALFDSALISRYIRKRVQHLQLIRTYKGIRHRKGLPVRGQRTHTNAKTRKKHKKNEFVFKNLNVSL
jgi:hypothetical protein